ncbi:hypothetical protein K3495_g15767, partial [Podosphaera aphanis]
MEGIFVGYTNSSKIFRIFIPVRRTVVITRQVTFPITESGEVPIEILQSLPSDPPAISPPSTPTALSPLSTPTSTPPMSKFRPIHTRPLSPDPNNLPGTFVDTPCTAKQPPQATPFRPNNSSDFLNAPKKPHESFILLGVPPVRPIKLEPTDPSSSSQPSKGQPRRSNRERKQADPGKDMVPHTQRYRANAVKMEPTTYRQAMQSDDYELWGKAIEEEMDALNRNNTWDVVPRPKDHNVVGSKWVFKIKHKADGTVDRYKARL